MAEKIAKFKQALKQLKCKEDPKPKPTNERAINDTLDKSNRSNNSIVDDVVSHLQVNKSGNGRRAEEGMRINNNTAKEEECVKRIQKRNNERNGGEELSMTKSNQNTNTNTNTNTNAVESKVNQGGESEKPHNINTNNTNSNNNNNTLSSDVAHQSSLPKQGRSKNSMSVNSIAKELLDREWSSANAKTSKSGIFGLGSRSNVVARVDAQAYNKTVEEEMSEISSVKSESESNNNKKRKVLEPFPSSSHSESSKILRPEEVDMNDPTQHFNVFASARHELMELIHTPKRESEDYSKKLKPDNKKRFFDLVTPPKKAPFSCQESTLASHTVTNPKEVWSNGFESIEYKEKERDYPLDFERGKTETKKHEAATLTTPAPTTSSIDFEYTREFARNNQPSILTYKSHNFQESSSVHDLVDRGSLSILLPSPSSRFEYNQHRESPPTKRSSNYLTSPTPPFDLNFESEYAPSNFTKRSTSFLDGEDSCNVLPEWRNHKRSHTIRDDTESIVSSTVSDTRFSFERSFSNSDQDMIARGDWGEKEITTKNVKKDYAFEVAQSRGSFLEEDKPNWFVEAKKRDAHFSPFGLGREQGRVLRN